MERQLLQQRGDTVNSNDPLVLCARSVNRAFLYSLALTVQYVSSSLEREGGVTIASAARHGGVVNNDFEKSTTAHGNRLMLVPFTDSLPHTNVTVPVRL